MTGKGMKVLKSTAMIAAALILMLSCVFAVWQDTALEADAKAKTKKTAKTKKLTKAEKAKKAKAAKARKAKAKKEYKQDSEQAKKAGLKRYKSKKGLRKAIKAIRKREDEKRAKFYEFLRKNRTSSGIDIMEDSMVKAAPTESSAANSASDHSETYTQVQGVDEADVVKTDGKYLYHVMDQDRVAIRKLDNGKAEIVSVVKEDLLYGPNEPDNYVSDIYVKGDKLVVVSHGSKVLKSKNVDGSYVWLSRATVIDISDRKDPKLITSYAQSGDLVSSRMIGNYLYLVTDEYVSEYRKNYQPYVSKDKKGKKIKRMPVKNIYSFPNPMSTNYAIVGAISINSKDARKARSKAVLGATSDIFCSLRNLYIARSSYGYYFDSYDFENNSLMGGREKTKFLKASLRGGRLRFVACGEVPGYINDQFSMDEENGEFRVATTVTGDDGNDINHVYVLNKRMKIKGKTEGFGKDEHIKAVRFIGDTAYVITYVTTDPLFVIDLKDSSKPEIMGSVEITGFSTLLHPVDSGTLLGVGIATHMDKEYDIEIQDGLKFALFDVRDRKAPKVADSKEYKNIGSPAQYDHRAFMVNGKKDYYAVPYYSMNSDRGGVIVLKVNDGKIKILKKWKSKLSVDRCVYAGSYIYAVDYRGNVKSFKL